MALTDNNKFVYDVYNDASITPKETVSHSTAVTAPAFVRLSKIENQTCFAFGFGIRTLVRDRQQGITGAEVKFNTRDEGAAR